MPKTDPPLKKIPALVIFAPTATGKTELLFKLFGQGGVLEKIPVKIISADSMQVYRGMDIGTAKPSPQEQKILFHHMIDIKNPDEQFNAADFVFRADSLCAEFFSKGCLPVICGGTGFYIRNFLLGLPDTPESDPDLRNKLKEELSVKGPAFMWEKLFSVDPGSAKKINPNDSFRVLRALEIFSLTGRPRSCFVKEPTLREQYDFTTLILTRPREELYRRIEDRVEKMFAQGLEAEARALTKKYPATAPGMQAIGYREFFEVGKDGKPLSGQEVCAKIKHDSKRYAKKQYVFMDGIPGAEIIDISLPSYIDKIVQKVHNILRIDTNL